MKYFRSALCFITLFAICAVNRNLMADTSDPALSQSTSTTSYYSEVTLEKYPDADAVLVSSVEEIRYQPDGSYISEDESVIKVLTEKGRREESVINFSYSARYGIAKLIDVSIIGSDGKKVKVDFAKTTKESTDNSSMSANIYDPMDRMVTCAVPTLKVGDVLVYRIRREITKARVKNHFASISILEWSCPIVRSVVRIIAPKDRPLKRIALRNPLGNVTYTKREQKDGSVVHEWIAKDSPQAFSEPSMPPLYTQVQNLYMSTANDWEEISKWYWDLCVPHLSKGTAEMTNCVNKIVSSVGAGGSDIEKISAIYKWVAQEIRYMGLTMEETSPGYAPHDIDVTFNNRYGVCRDKAALLAAMLRIAGFESYPVLIHAGAKMDSEVPLPYFNHAMTAVRAPGNPIANKDGYILMDPTDESSRDIMPAYLCDRSYLVATPFGEKLHVSSVPSSDENALVIKSEASVEKEGAMLVESTLLFKGYNDNAYRGAFLTMRDEERRRMIERIINNAFSGAELLSLDFTPEDLQKTEEPFTLKIFYRINEAIVRGESRDELLVPYLSRAMGAANWLLSGSTSLQKRRFPLRVSTTAKTDESIRIKLGESLGESKFLPEDIAIEGGYSYKRHIEVVGRELRASRILAINDVEFSPDDYEKLLESIKSVEASERARAIFAKSQSNGANVRYKELSNFVSVTAPISWVSTNIVEKEILTYEGKKGSSELMFEYNPTWKHVEVLSAVVSNKNGKVASVSPHEKTVLDASWASAAPRYPASKRLVVNLPSVEIGSVIRYVTVTTVTNSPLPFYASWNFDSFEPVDLMCVEYSDWTGETYSRRDDNLKIIPTETMLPPSYVWRDVKTISLCNFSAESELLRNACEVAPNQFGADLVRDAATDKAKAQVIRDWMAENVRVVGPALYEVPLKFHMTNPEVVVSERYGSHLDYIRTMCALMKGAGLEAKIVFAANDASSLEESVWRNLHTHPAVGVYSTPLCRVRIDDGAIIGLWGKESVYYFGAENEYTPIEAAACEGSTFLDPSSPMRLLGASSYSSMEKIASPNGDDYDAKIATTYNIFVRENGAVDIDYEQSTYGRAVGTMRKFYSEILPEDRSRHFQAMLGSLSKGAAATRELSYDVKGYPFKYSFSAFIPNYASRSGDMMTLSLPEIGSQLFALSGTSRKSPLCTNAITTESIVTLRVIFPSEYSEIEHVPDSFDFGDGMRTLEVSRSVDDDGRLVVTVVQHTKPSKACVYPSSEFNRLKGYSRIASSRANRIVSVRKAKAVK